MKLLTKFSLINMLVMVCIFLISSAIIYYLVQAIVIREMDADLKGIEDKISAYVKQFNRFPAGNPLDEEKMEFQPTGNLPVARNIQMLLLYSDREKKMHNFRQSIFPLRINNTWYKVTISKPVGGLHHLSSALIRITLITILVSILILLILNNILLLRLWRPFYESLDIMRHFKLGKTSSLHFPATTVAEFSFMNESLIMATQKAEQDYLLLKEFTENASHEMQTPLSIIRSKLDVLIQETGLSEKQSELVQGAYASIKKLSRLSHSLLLLAKIENQQFDNIQPIDLKQKLAEKLEQFQELWMGNQIQTHFSISESFINMSPELLEVLLNNLFSNAYNHNKPSGSIEVELHPYYLSVSNTGSSGPLDEGRLFTRFYKESLNSNSNGLGLSIIKQIAKVSSLSLAYSYSANRHCFTLSWN